MCVRTMAHVSLILRHITSRVSVHLASQDMSVSRTLMTVRTTVVSRIKPASMELIPILVHVLWVSVS